MIQWRLTQIQANWRRSHPGITGNFRQPYGTSDPQIGLLKPDRGYPHGGNEISGVLEQTRCWVVRVGGQHYGAYLNKEQAILDAIDAAGDAQADGHDAHVWDAAARVF